jgi:hypothetical protein
MRKWKWLFVNVYHCKGPVYIAKVFLTRLIGTNALMFWESCVEKWRYFVGTDKLRLTL